MPPPMLPACLLVAVQEVFGPAHWPERQAARCLLSSQTYLPRVFEKFAHDFFFQWFCYVDGLTSWLAFVFGPWLPYFSGKLPLLSAAATARAWGFVMPPPR